MNWLKENGIGLVVWILIIGTFVYFNVNDKEPDQKVNSSSYSSEERESSYDDHDPSTDDG